MSDPIPDASTVRRAQGLVAAYRAGRVQIVADRPGNPLRAEIRRFDGAVATRVPPFGRHPFNRACGFSDALLDAAEAVADWYEEAGVPAGFEIAPGEDCERLFALLHRRGYRHTGFHAVFAGPAELPRSGSDGLEVRHVAGGDDLRAFSDAYHRGWAHAGPPVPMEPWLAAPGWRLYLALCNGEPAGAAILYRGERDAYLADAAVDPRHRRRGVHRALLDRRCADAAADGADGMFAGADYLSASYRNMLRKGLALLCTKAIWTRAAA